MSNEQAVVCRYHGVDRLTHPDVCMWHVERNDAECRKLDCKTFKLLDRKQELAPTGARNGPERLESKGKY